MIDIDSAIEKLIKYTQQFGDNPKIDIKRRHSLRVMQNCEKLAVYLNLNNE